MARVYATEAEYRTWSGDLDATVSESLLARASLAVDYALIGAWYSVNGEGMPIETVHIEALRDATCAQAQWYDETGDTSGSGAADQMQSASIGSAAYTKGYTGGGSNAGGMPSLCPTASQILRVAGFTVQACIRG